MKKLVALLLAVALLAGALALVGCGEAGKAQGYMKTGDDLSLKLSAYGGEKQAAYDAGALLADVGISLANSTDLASTGTKAKLDIDKLIAQGKEAKVEYSKIMDVNGVTDYKEYARLRNQAIDSEIAVLQQLKGLIDALMKPGGGSSQQKISDYAKSHATVVTDFAQAVLYSKDAAKLKKDKNL